MRDTAFPILASGKDHCLMPSMAGPITEKICRALSSRSDII
jgi:hypothetical protein